MWQSWLSGSTIPALEQTAAFAQKRHVVLAGNIANRDTPGYKTRDVSVDKFQDALKDAVQSTNTVERDRYGNMVTVPEAMEKVRDVSNQIEYHTGNDVSLEMQVTQISKNQSMHNMAISLMRSQFRSLQVAIQESAAV
jgi:flagellar basal-body rod protein FlgB